MYTLLERESCLPEVCLIHLDFAINKPLFSIKRTVNLEICLALHGQD